MRFKLSTSIFAAATLAIVGTTQAQDEAQSKTFEPEVCGRVEQDFLARAKRYQGSVNRVERPQISRVAVDPLSPDFMGCLDEMIARADDWANDIFVGLPEDLKMISEEDMSSLLKEDFSNVYLQILREAPDAFVRNSQEIKIYRNKDDLIEADKRVIFRLLDNSQHVLELYRNAADRSSVDYNEIEFEYLHRAFDALTKAAWPDPNASLPFGPGGNFTFEKGRSPS